MRLPLLKLSLCTKTHLSKEVTPQQLFQLEDCLTKLADIMVIFGVRDLDNASRRDYLTTVAGHLAGIDGFGQLLPNSLSPYINKAIGAATTLRFHLRPALGHVADLLEKDAQSKFDLQLQEEISVLQLVLFFVSCTNCCSFRTRLEVLKKERPVCTLLRSTYRMSRSECSVLVR